MAGDGLTLKAVEVAKIDLDDNETRNRIIAEAIDGNTLQERGNEGEKLACAPNQETPYTEWAKEMYDNGQIEMLAQIKDVKQDGLLTWWYENGQKRMCDQYKDGKEHGLKTRLYEDGRKKGNATYKDGKLLTAVAWKPNGKKCPVTNIVNGNGISVWYNPDGTEKGRMTHKDGVKVED